MRLKSLLALAVAGGLLLGLNGRAGAEDYPNRQVKIIIAFSPSGAIDILGRFIADKLSKMWGQSVIVENRPGGSGNIGAAAASTAAPDGYTLHFGAQTMSVNVTLSPTTAFDPIASFDPIMLVATSVEVFQVSAMTPYNSVQEVIDYAKANPGKLNYYSVGIGSTSHLSTVLFMDVTGTKMQHVPYSQMSQGMSDLMSGRTEINFGPMGSSIANIRSGKMRALALNGPERSKLLPDVPTLEELGVKMGQESSWYGVFAPKGTPKEIIAKINKDLQTVIDTPEMRERELQLGYRYFGGPPERLAAYLKADIEKWQTLDKKGAFK
jgi:tripartite-type tricarboxylate transporter receptor subunit TctC